MYQKRKKDVSKRNGIWWCRNQKTEKNQAVYIYLVRGQGVYTYVVRNQKRKTKIRREKIYIYVEEIEADKKKKIDILRFF